MGKPFNGDAGSGFHLHLSLCGEDGANAFADTAGEEGCARAPAALHRGRDRARAGADGVPQPDRQRLPAHRPARARADARLLGLRQPLRARARAARARRRDARRDAARRRLGQPLPGDRRPAVRRARRRQARADAAGAPSHGLVYELPEEEQGDPIPLSLDAALDALEADTTLRDAMGARSSTRSSRSSASSSSATTATSPTGTSRSTHTTSKPPSRESYQAVGQQVAHGGDVRERREAVGLGGQRGRLHVVRRTVRSPSARSRVAVPSVRKIDVEAALDRLAGRRVAAHVRHEAADHEACARRTG